LVSVTFGQLAQRWVIEMLGKGEREHKP